MDDHGDDPQKIQRVFQQVLILLKCNAPFSGKVKFKLLMLF